MVGVLTGRKIRLRRDTRTNLMLLVLAPSGAGKDRARKVAKKVLIAANCADMVGQDRISSHAGIISQLKASPASLLQPDEFHATIDSACHAKNSPHLKHIPEILKEAYSSVDDPLWKPSGYGDRKFNVEINQPHLVLHAVGVGEEFWEACSRELITGGVIGRMVLFETGSRRSDPIDVTVDEPPKDLIEQAAWWRDFAGDGNLFTVNPRPLVIEETLSARERLLRHMKEINGRQSGEGPLRAALWARSAQKTGQLALTFAASRQTGCKEIVVDLQDVELAIRLNNWSTRKLAWHCEQHMTDSAYKKLVNKVLAPITVAGISRRVWTQKTYKITDRNTRERILQDAIDAGHIQAEEIQTGKRPKSILKARSGDKRIQ